MSGADNHIVTGVLVGTVASEPDDLGRVEVRYDWMEGENTSLRAPIATYMSGDRRGGWIMPEVGDEVLVAFDQGRFDHPFVIGFLWNGSSRPPNEDIDREVRRLETVSGHQIDLDDRDGQTKITLHSAGGHELALDDGSETEIRATTNGGHSISMSDSGNTVAVESNGGNKITINDAGGTIRLESSAGMSLEIDSAGKVSISAAMGVEVNTLRATFSGILEAKLVKGTLGQFQSVICPTFAPGRGTTLP